VSAPPPPESFLSGRTGHVGPRRAVPLRAADALCDLALRLRGVPGRLDRLAAVTPRRRVLALCVYRPESDRAAAAARELGATRHDLRLAFGSTGAPRADLAQLTVAEGLGGGKFENLNRLLSAAGPGERDWTLVVDDDVALPRRFLDRLLAVCEQLRLELAQPAQTLASHAAWPVTRRRRGAIARETRFVEIGPVTAFGRAAAGELLPFPELRFGWGLDLHWAALARERGWRVGVVDALAVRHDLAGVASSYGQAEAVAEAQRFLAGRAWLPAAEAGETLAVHRGLG
jgi:Glycosyltransferase like family 2